MPAWLLQLADGLEGTDIDVSGNLNDREWHQRSLLRPRLGRFPDIAIGEFPDSIEILSWEESFLEGQIAGVAILDATGTDHPELIYEGAFNDAWIGSADEQRFFLSYSRNDQSFINELLEIIQQAEIVIRVVNLNADVQAAAMLFATSGVRMALDSNQARDVDSDAREFAYLGERVRRDHNSLFAEDSRGGRRLTRNEPAVFLKETLGTEHEASTIEQIIVPGGIALGETALLPLSMQQLLYRDQQLKVLDSDGKEWALPDESPATVKALFDFVNRSHQIGSDAIVDIDERGRVRISSALRDTDVGYDFVAIDARPFEFVRGLPVTKSVIIDSEVKFTVDPDATSLAYESVYEVRFLGTDNFAIAQTQVALEYQAQGVQGPSTYEYSWGPAVHRLADSLDYEGLGEATQAVSRYAAWVALFRAVVENEVPFLNGRYEFMKIDKSGRVTPRRF